MLVFISNGKITCFGLKRPSSGFDNFLQKGVIQVSQEECARLREGVPYAKVYRYNPKHLCPKLNGYGDNSQ